MRGILVSPSSIVTFVLPFTFFLLPLIKFKQTQLLHIYFSVELFFFFSISYYKQPWSSKNSSKLYSLEIVRLTLKLSPGPLKEYSSAHVGWVTALQEGETKMQSVFYSLRGFQFASKFPLVRMETCGFNPYNTEPASHGHVSVKIFMKTHNLNRIKGEMSHLGFSAQIKPAAGLLKTHHICCRQLSVSCLILNKEFQLFCFYKLCYFATTATTESIVTGEVVPCFSNLFVIYFQDMVRVTNFKSV